MGALQLPTKITWIPKKAVAQTEVAQRKKTLFATIMGRDCWKKGKLGEYWVFVGTGRVSAVFNLAESEV